MCGDDHMYVTDKHPQSDMYPELAFTDAPAHGGEPCRVCTQVIPSKAHPVHRTRHVCSPERNERLKRWHKRRTAENHESAAKAENQPDPANPQVHLYSPHAEWTSSGGRGYAENLWKGIRGGYVLSLSTGITKVGRASSVAARLKEHFKHCENYGVDVIDVAVLSTAGDLLLMEQSLKRFVKGHPNARVASSATESAFGVPFTDIADFLVREQLGDLWIPTTAAESVANYVFDSSSAEAMIESALNDLREQDKIPEIPTNGLQDAT
ncbi:hypothetical protein FHR84_003153 [Actinopolyspora biskrensis]|uniref:Uncharacterized protein n=2 Tax=Actinopolyspora biskrensis TaxID=1470178 RepID=A0A852Z3F3_9ACTN|nr:hypothetical protein [Actinopolyspora biskrensis]